MHVPKAVAEPDSKMAKERASLIYLNRYQPNREKDQMLKSPERISGSEIGCRARLEDGQGQGVPDGAHGT